MNTPVRRGVPGRLWRPRYVPVMTIGCAAPPAGCVNVLMRFWHRWLLWRQKILLDAWASPRHTGLAAANRGAQFADARGRPSRPRPMEERGRRNRQQAARSTVMDHTQEVAVTSISHRHEGFATTPCALACVRGTALFCLPWADTRASSRMHQRDTASRASVPKLST